MAFMLSIPAAAATDVPPQAANERNPSAIVPEASRLDAMRSGVDLSRLSTKPGVHIVALADSPFTGALADQIRSDIQAQAEQGSFLSTQDNDAALRPAARGPKNRLERWLDTSYPSLDAARPHLRYDAMSVAGTALAHTPVQDIYPSGKLDKGKWSGVTRTWLVSGLGNIQLSEAEYRESGTSITLIREWLNTQVSGFPATLKTVRYASGTTVVSVAWVTDSTSYELALRPLDPKAVKANEQALLALANDLGR
ncbi:hypothetical protein [Luteibacter aegosomatissinici]|uniref:hypothetical protein n=1 Tax=Luteibacter aegosomatissinici TaxID=2911539 RepID=UPI001FF898AB|nr:hypothetical protein [Luteibacter aegosomatissinici]UPG93913.1 hypothetical protein L2Y97_19070 [Luteibacter aegosomatissinici]